MARKKLIPSEELSPTPNPEPKTRTRKAAPKGTEEKAPEAAPKIETTPAPRRTRTTKVPVAKEPEVAQAPVTPETAPTPKQGRTRRKPQSANEPAVPEVVEAPPASPARNRRTSRKPAKPASTVSQAQLELSLPVDEDERVTVRFRPRSSEASTTGPEQTARSNAPRSRKDQRAPKAEKAQPILGDQQPQTISIGNEELVVLKWRSSSKQSESSSSDSKNLAPRKGKRRRDDESESPITAAEAIKPMSTEDVKSGRRDRRKHDTRVADQPVVQSQIPLPPAPTKPIRETIAVPSDAPQVVVRDGVPLIAFDRKLIPPLFFFGNALDERRAENVFEQIRMASENGVHTFIHYVELEVETGSVSDSVAFAGYLLNKTREIDPSAHVMFRVVFTAPANWEQKFPAARYVMADNTIAEPSFSDDDFWDVAAQCLEKFVAKLRVVDTHNAVLGVHLERGEWFYAAGSGYDNSEAATKKFRDWLRVRYRNDIVALRASWFDGRAKFETLLVPPFETERTEDFIRNGRKARRWVDYHLFLSDMACERIQSLAYVAKKASEGRYLVGVSYGYTFEWNHAASGHLSLGKLLRTPELDIIAGPPSYRNREPGGSCSFPCPIDSFALNNKMYVSEEDFKTPMSGTPEPDDFNPVIRTPQALENVQWRGLGSAMAHGSGVCWMDLWGNGWLSSPGIWQRGKQCLESLFRRSGTPQADPDVAVFIDERSLAYLADQEAFSLLVQNVREAVLRSGLSAGFYLLSDLAHRENFPESKLHVFVNAWDIRPEVRSAIKSRLQCKGKVLFWLYAAGLFDSGRDSLERVREVTGIALKPQPFACKSGTTLLNRRHPLGEALPERVLATGSQLEPSYFAIPEDSLVLGEYSQTGLPSYVVREFRDEQTNEHEWTSVFLGEPVVTPALFRALGAMAGAQAWNYNDDVVHVRVPFLSIHCTSPGGRMITLPNKWAAYSLSHGEWAARDATHLRFQALDGATYTYLVGPQSELESILSKPLDELQMIEELPTRPENTLHLDAINFDIPIMKLDEWVEEGSADDLADGLLFKPGQLDTELPEGLAELDKPSGSKTSGRRRKRGRRQRPNGGNGVSTAVIEADSGEPFNDLSMNVVFRKRV
ncbi:MAG: hypothetical protein JST40_06450 [Armatimonadetes bacterium]|nr:hypothetical protein [Armatimonadota bacterium]